MESLATSHIAWPEGPFALEHGAVPQAGVRFCYAAGLVLAVGSLALAALLFGLPLAGNGQDVRFSLPVVGKPHLLTLLALAATGALLLRIASLLNLPRRLARHGRIVEADLLRRRMLPGQGAVWDFAYDWQGRRIYGRSRVSRDPLILDGTVTRGAVLAMGRGRHRLLLAGLAPLRLPADKAERIAAEIASQFHAERPQAGSSLAILAASEPRDWAKRFAAAQVDAWNAPDVPQVNAAIERRHAAAWRGGTRDLDALLQRIRAALPRARAWRG